ncbi:MAG: hypothetical protein HYS81_04815 [Candidatus Aenigmatarchaeota archaeon]|nr:MAG: hypothetical protein HYS81_04815 [Candidatus Aenigmarchaeota archaeon]
MKLALVILIVLISGCVSAPNETQEIEGEAGAEAPENETVGETVHSDDPLASHKQTLRAGGIDCSFENTYDTRNSLVIDPSGRVLYVGVEGKGIFKSTDAGATWKPSSNGILAYPDNKDLTQKCYPDMAGMVMDPANSQRLLLAPADVSTGPIDWSYSETAGIWETLDGGKSWHQIVHGDMNAGGTGAIALDPNDPMVIYYGVNSDPATFNEAPHKEVINEKGPMYRTADGGQTWAEVDSGMLPGLQATAIFVGESSQEIMLMTQSHSHVYHPDYIEEIFTYEQFGPMRSVDGGRTWTALAAKLPSPYQNVFDADVAEQNFDHVFVRPFLFGDKFPSDAEQKSFVSMDRGDTFEQTPVFVWVGRYDPHDSEGDHIIGYSPWYADGDLVESYDAGRTWQPVAQPDEIDNTNVRISNIVWDPNDAGTIYMSGTDAHVWKSPDSGKTWQKVLDLEKINGALRQS